MTSPNGYTVLVADDEEGMRFGLEKTLSLEGYRVLTAASGAEVDRIAAKERVDCAFVDLQLPDVQGLELVSRLRENDTPVVIITAYATVETAVHAMKLGAVDYIQKPFDNRDLVDMADRLCLRGTRASALVPIDGTNELVVESEAMRTIVATIRKVRDTDIPILLQGESGTGKEVLARLIHHQSTRSDKPFMAINCAAIPPELLESELFGHQKGSYTGAHTDKIGKFEVASDGTIFLDEIGDMGTHLQTKLLRALEERSFEAVGSTRAVPLRARIIASTNADLPELIRMKRFRLDLYYRLKGISLTIPPLRERREDIEPLLALFLNRYRLRYQKPGVEVSREAIRYLRAYSWPGNVRELKNAVESAVLLSDGHRPLLPQDFLLENPTDTNLPELWRREKEAIMEVLGRTSFNRSLAAAELGMSRKTLYNKMKKYGIQ